MDTQLACDKLAEKYHQKCYELDHGFNQGIQDLLDVSRTKAQAYSVGLSRIKTLVDLISMGYDVLYFDAHQYFFRNPLKYMYTRTTAHVVVSGTPKSGCSPQVPGPNGELPDEHHRLDIAFVRTTPATFRCIYNWLYWSMYTSHDVNDKPLDHHTFRNVMQECVTTLGMSVLSVGYLDPHAFPSECHTKCGCLHGQPVVAAADGSCPKEGMDQWVGYLLSCSGNAANLDGLMAKYSAMYSNAGINATL
ncbi:hypothetical protein GPECTOR_55g305 [Gonium pectorale]|uniref:Nucleotide-diphospho-sugar transferase domain-containing protein n=1 Tax=Gonium pectorale TaxID=33097 RepID=A0A150G697_GONPE|nr:hypothetical protein GPECTOR_55g305 [Gonium pectorale]|eukprot:KXZ45399.1 hypothetical protein GPECTOR_55g305 [Gonium pectorale]